MTQEIKNFLKYALVSGKKIAAGLTLMSMTAAFAPVRAENQEVKDGCPLPENMSDVSYHVDYEGCAHVNARKIMRDKYGKQNYKKCYVYKTAQNTIYDIELEDGLKIQKHLPPCGSVVYYVADGENGEKHIRFQCDYARAYNIDFVTDEETLNKNGACNLINNVFEVIRGR